MAQKESNNGLYFIVGALFVAVVVMGFFLVSPVSNENTVIREITQTEPAGNDDSSANFDLNITDDGFNANVSKEEN